MKLLLLFILLLATTLGNAQLNEQPLPDSIQQKIELIKQDISTAETDSAKVRLCIRWYVLAMKHNERLALEPLLMAVDVCEKNLQKEESNPYCIKQYGNLLMGAGSTYKHLYNYPAALKCYFKAIKHGESDKSTSIETLLASYVELATLYKKMEKHDLALEYYDKMLSHPKAANSRHLSGALHNKANLLSNMGRDQEAILLFTQAIPLATKRNKPYAYSSMSENYFQIGKRDSAYFFLEKALSMEQEAETNNFTHLTTIYAKFAFFYYKDGMYSESLLAADQLLEYAQKVSSIEGKIDAYKRKTYCYIALNKTEKALENYELYIEINDSFNTLSQEELAYELNAEYEYAKKSVADSLININKITLLEQDNQQKIKEEKTKTTFAYIGLGVVLLFLVFMGIAYRQKKTIAKGLEEKNLLIEQSLRDKEAFMKEIHHRVKNNMQMVSSVLALKARESDNEQITKVLEESQARIYSMSLSHQKMYQENNFEQINVSAYIKDIINTLFVSDNKSNLAKLNFEAKDISINIDQAQAVGFIVHELVANSIKHAWAENSKKQLDIVIEQKNDEVQVLYKDNGKGLPATFSIDKVSSMGLKLVKAFTKRQLKGAINFSSEKGCKVLLTFIPR